MKKIILVLFAAFVAFSANAQAGRFGTGQDSVECVKYLSYYKEYMKHNNIAEATNPWRNAFAICPPTASENMILDGQKIMRSLISKSKDAKLRAAYIDTLLMLADLRAEVYPKNAVKALNNKVKDINNFKWNADNPEVLYAEYERIFKANG
ncbi:MAG: hypothetical protein HUJ91_07070, partial [Bacteroidales bacterium]|nr:hypothetical protein [Bacteroidales bacterium]